MTNNVHEALGLNPTDAMAQSFARQVDDRQRQLEERARKYCSPRGRLRLPALLDERRLEHAIPDGAFDYVATFSRVLVWQVSDFSMRFTEGGIALPETTKDRLEAEASRGILLSGGLRALDVLVSNGMALGHIVRFCHLHPYTLPVQVGPTTLRKLRILDVGDIIATEDLAAELRAGRQFIERHVDGDGADAHMVGPRDGMFDAPITPEPKADY